ncbi:MAG: ABC transporter permease, partial [Elusimicrobia bacterium]|nr:ABC transporter permease [Elusimicrobiota bacterium]
MAGLKKRIYSLAENVGGAGEMVASVFYWMFKKPDGKDHLLKQMVRVGVDSVPIVILSSLFTGMVLSLQSGVASIRLFNQPVFMGTLVSFTMVLELGPVLTAMVVSGRVGASISAELGTMKVTEQLDALYTLGTTPERYLVTPLFISMFIMLPILTLFANLLGIIGGYLVTVFSFGIPGSVYMNDVLSYLQIVHFA